MLVMTFIHLVAPKGAVFLSSSTQREVVYIPVAAPPSSTTLGTTLIRTCSMYRMHLSFVILAVQNSRIPATCSSFVDGFMCFRRYHFNSCHKSSIGFKSGLSGGVSHQNTATCVSDHCPVENGDREECFL